MVWVWAAGYFLSVVVPLQPCHVVAAQLVSMAVPQRLVLNPGEDVFAVVHEVGAASLLICFLVGIAEMRVFYYLVLRWLQHVFYDAVFLLVLACWDDHASYDLVSLFESPCEPVNCSSLLHFYSAEPQLIVVGVWS
jgi:hypothetical protein